MSSIKPRIIVDARMVGPEGHGISLYVQQMAKGLAQLDLPYELFYLLARECPSHSKLRELPHAESKIPFLHPSELWKLSSELKRFSPALYHTPSFSSLWRYPCNHVQTVHDLNHLHFGGLAQKAYYRFVLLDSICSAQATISVSQSAALEIRSWLIDYGFDADIKVVPNAIEEFPSHDDAAVLRRFGLEHKQFFFCIANRKPHKNLKLLLEAYAEARQLRSLPPLALSVPGTTGDGLVYTGSLGDSEVGALLRSAKAFFFPSLYEGFGRPPVEAALAGTIPVVSSIDAHREVLEGVSEAIFLDPNSSAAWRNNLLQMANASAEVSERSRNWIRDTWSVKRQAKKMDEIYRACLSSD